MSFQRSILAHAVSCALAGISIARYAQQADKSLSPVVVPAEPFGSQEQATFLSQARVLSGDSLRDKIGGSLGEKLIHKPGPYSHGYTQG